MKKNQILNLQLYNTQKPKPEGPQVQTTSFMPSFNTNPFFPPHMANMLAMNPMMGMYPTVNVNKIYDIHVGGVSQNLRGVSSPELSVNFYGCFGRSSKRTGCPSL